MSRRIVSRAITPTAYGLPAVDAEAAFRVQLAAWEAADPSLAKTLVERTQGIPPATRQVICDLVALLAINTAADAARGRLAHYFPMAAPQLLLSLRPRVDARICEFLVDRPDDVRAAARSEVIPALFSLLEHPTFSDETNVVARAIASYCRTQGSPGSTQLGCEFDASEESRLLALLASENAGVRRAVADMMAEQIAWVLAYPNPAYTASPSEHAMRRYDRWFGALMQHAEDAAIVPALARAARENRDRRALPVLRAAVLRHDSDEVRASAVAAIVELGGASEAKGVLRDGTPAIQEAALTGLPTTQLRTFLGDSTKPLPLRVHALWVLSERRDIRGKFEFGQDALERIARDPKEHIELRRAAFAVLCDDRVPYGDPLREELERAVAKLPDGVRRSEQNRGH